MTKILGVEITSPEKIIYPKYSTKKIDVVKYYEKISILMLEFIKNRPLAVIRCHQNLQNCFFKKHPTTESINTFFDGDEEYFFLKSAKDIIFQVQMGTLEFHPWGARFPKITQPDFMIFDLDPAEDVSLERLCEGVFDLKNLLTSLHLKSFLKTSGGKGYHIVVPFKKSKNWEGFSDFSKKIAQLLEAKFPQKYTTNIRKVERKGKIFIDYLRNTKGATCVAPYSLRARDDASISWPISWKDLGVIKPNSVNIANFDKFLSLKNEWEEIHFAGQILK